MKTEEFETAEKVSVPQPCRGVPALRMRRSLFTTLVATFCLTTGATLASADELAPASVGIAASSALEDEMTEIEQFVLYKDAEIPDEILSLQTSDQPVAIDQIELESGEVIDVTVQSAQPTKLPPEIIYEENVQEEDSFVVLQNPEMAAIFVTGLFGPPAAGGPEFESNRQLQSAERDLAGFDPNRAIQIENAFEAALVTDRLLQLGINPRIILPNEQNTNISSRDR